MLLRYQNPVHETGGFTIYLFTEMTHLPCERHESARCQETTRAVLKHGCKAYSSDGQRAKQHQSLKRGPERAKERKRQVLVPEQGRTLTKTASGDAVVMLEDGKRCYLTQSVMVDAIGMLDDDG